MSFLFRMVAQLSEDTPSVAKVERDMLQEELIRKDQKLREAAEREQELLRRFEEQEESRNALWKMLVEVRGANGQLTLEKENMREKLEESLKALQHSYDRGNASTLPLEDIEEQVKHLQEELKLKMILLQKAEKQNKENKAKIEDLEDKSYLLATECDYECDCRETSEQLLETVWTELSFYYGRAADLENKLHDSEKEKKDLSVQLEKALDDEHDLRYKFAEVQEEVEELENYLLTTNQRSSMTGY